MEDKTIGLLILGIVAVIAIVGLITMFSEMSKSGAFMSTPTWTMPKITIPQSQCPSGTASYNFATAQSIMQKGVGRCTQKGPRWCCAKLPVTSMPSSGVKLPSSTTTINRG